MPSPSMRPRFDVTPTLRYGEVVKVVDAARGAGVTRVGIVTEGMRVAAGRP